MTASLYLPQIYKDIPQSTLSRWVKQFREAEAKEGCGYVGLLPHTSSRGNRQPKAPKAASELLDKFITEHFETPRQAPAASVYRAYTRACLSLNIQPLSERTFYTRLKKRPTHEQTLKRKGKKAAYATEPIVLELAKTTFRHGDRPFAICHIDHTQLDIEISELMQHWLYFYEHCIGCVGVLKDWLIRTVAAALDDGSETLTLKQLHEHTLTLAQCERMALDTTEGEQKLSYMESRREHLWHLLQIGMDSTSIPKAAVDLSFQTEAVVVPPSKSSKPPSKHNHSKHLKSLPNVLDNANPNEMLLDNSEHQNISLSAKNV